MRTCKPLIALGLGVFTYGVAYDIVHYDDANTVSRVPFATAVSTATGSAVTYTSNYVTGDELRMSPREVKAQSVRAPIPPIRINRTWFGCGAVMHNAAA